MARRYPLRWDPGNVAHIRRHDVIPQDVEDVCAGRPLRGGAKMGRTLLTGPTRSGRMLTVVLEFEVGGTYRPITARPASRKERRRYAEELEGETS